MERPRLKAHFITEVADESSVFLLAAGQHYLVRGNAAAKVLPYLDGRHTVAEIAQAVGSEVPFPELFLAIRKYEAAGHLAEGRPDLPAEVLAYWDAQGIDPAAAQRALASTEFAVLAGTDADAGPVADALRRAGLRVRPATASTALGNDDGSAAGPTVVVVNDYLDPVLARVNDDHLAAGHPWVLVKPTGVRPWLGPLLRPGETGCWACMAQRISGNRQVERYLAGKRGEETPQHPERSALPAGVHATGDMLALALARAAAAGAEPSLQGQMITLDPATLTTMEHTLVRLPQCRVCGDPTLTTERSPKVLLSEHAARHSTDGGYRVEPPATTYTRLERHISPFLGAVTGVHKVSEGADNGLTYAFAAGHNFAMLGDSMDLLRRNLRGQSGGKGRTEIQARVSAVCEAIERYSGVWRGDEPVRHGAYDDLAADLAVHPNELLLFSDRQFAGRAEWNKDPAHRLHLVPDTFRTDLPIDWTAGWSLTHDRERLVPSAYAWYGHPDLNRHFFCVGDSNGSAAGNTLEEAILQGFCELVERDAVALWWYNRVRRPAFDMDSLRDPYIDRLREFYAGMGRSLAVLDITTDLGVPVFVGVSHRTDHPVQDIVVGFGAHPDPRIAALRALTEVNQFLPAVEQRDEDGNTIYKDDDIATRAWWQEATVQREPWVVPDPALPVRTVADHATGDGDDLARDVTACVERARSRGLEVIVLDQTRPDLELNVARVIVPGLRHFWRRLAPGRLYDVPVRLGWLPAPRGEDELNPRNVFF